MHALTYGVLPPKEKFLERFAKEVPDGEYDYTLKGEDAEAAQRADIPTEGTLSGEKLYGAIKKLVQQWEDEDDEEAGDLASSILSTIGFEWI